MPSTYSSLKIELMATGEKNTTWGDITNTNLGTALEQAIVGSADVTFASANVTISLTDTNASQTARALRLNLIGTTGGATRILLVPNIQKLYIVNNTCAEAISVRNSPSVGSSVSVPAGKTMFVYNTGSNVVDVTTHLTSLSLGTALPISSGGTGSNVGNASALTNLNASALASGTAPVARGGTGIGTYAVGDIIYASAATTLSRLAGVATGNALISGGVTTAPSWGKIGLTTHVSGTLPIANGGTNLTAAPTNGQLMVGNGTGYTLATITAGTGISVTNGSGTITIAATGGTGTVTSVAFSGGTTGLSVSGSPITTSGTITLSGTLVAANGGTGQSSYAVGDILYASTTTALSKLAGVATGNALISGGVGTAPSWGKIGLTTHVSGTLPVANGGTGATTLTGILVGNGTSAFTAVTAPSGTIVGTSDSQTLTNKTYSGGTLTGAAVEASNTVNDTGTIAAASPGFRGMPQNSQTSGYTLVLADAGKHISITTGNITIPANGSTAFPIGTTIVVFNDSSSSQTIAITTDTLRWAGTSSTGTRTLAGYGLATLVKVKSTEWVVSGAGIS